MKFKGKIIPFPKKKKAAESIVQTACFLAPFLGIADLFSDDPVDPFREVAEGDLVLNHVADQLLSLLFGIPVSDQ